MPPRRPLEHSVGRVGSPATERLGRTGLSVKAAVELAHVLQEARRRMVVGLVEPAVGVAVAAAAAALVVGRALEYSPSSRPFSSPGQWSPRGKAATVDSEGEASPATLVGRGEHASNRDVLAVMAETVATAERAQVVLAASALRSSIQAPRLPTTPPQRSRLERLEVVVQAARLPRTTGRQAFPAHCSQLPNREVQRRRVLQSTAVL